MNQVKSTVVRWRCLPHCKRAPVDQSWQIWKYFCKSWGIPPWKSYYCLLWEIPGWKLHWQYFCGTWNFGPDVVTSAIGAGNYVCGKRGIALISEALQRLQFSKFLETVDNSRFSDLFQHIAALQTLFKNINETTESIKSTSQSCQNEMNEFIEAVLLFKNKFSNISEQFQYFNAFLEQIAPVWRYFTRSYRESILKLRLSAVRRALPWCFAFDRVNYKRWLPLYYEDCLALPQNFPKIHEAFLPSQSISSLKTLGYRLIIRRIFLSWESQYRQVYCFY